MRSRQTAIHIADWLLPLVVAIGLFFIHFRTQHNWGDDFAQYLQEAENLAQGKALEAGSYQFNPSFPRIGPKVYPVGFPLLLSILSDTSGKIDTQTAQYSICIWAVLLGLFIHLTLKQAGIQRWWALACTTLFLYHPFFIGIKPDILSDIPCAALFMATVFAFGQSKRWWHFALVACLAGFTIATRSIGWVLPLGAVALFGTQLIQAKPNYFHLLFAGLSTFVGWIINFTTGYYSSAAEGYSLLFEGGNNILLQFNTNFRIYLETFEYYLTPFGNEHWQLLLLIMQKVFIGLLLIGIIKHIRRKPNFYGICTLGYTLVLLLYPYTGGFRFLLPILPFFFISISRGAAALRSIWPIQKPVGIAALLLLALAYYPELSRLEREENGNTAGPESPEAQALFNWLDTIPKQETILFLKPRALAYYTAHNCFATEPNARPVSFASDIEKFNTSYLIEADALPYPALEQYINTHSTLELLYEQAGFRVWRIPK